jgi:hypothetical protein
LRPPFTGFWDKPVLSATIATKKLGAGRRRAIQNLGSGRAANGPWEFYDLVYG